MNYVQLLLYRVYYAFYFYFTADYCCCTASGILISLKVSSKGSKMVLLYPILFCFLKTSYNRADWQIYPEYLYIFGAKSSIR